MFDFCFVLFSLLITGTIPRAVWQRVHNVRVHTELLWVLRGIGGQQRGRGMSSAAERNHRRLWWSAQRTAFPVYWEDQVDWRHLHGRIRTDQEYMRQQTVFARDRDGRLRAETPRTVGQRQRTLVQQFPHQNRYDSVEVIGFFFFFGFFDDSERTKIIFFLSSINTNLVQSLATRHIAKRWHFHNCQNVSRDNLVHRIKMLHLTHKVHHRFIVLMAVKNIKNP